MSAKERMFELLNDEHEREANTTMELPRQVTSGYWHTLSVDTRYQNVNDYKKKGYSYEDEHIDKKEDSEANGDSPSPVMSLRVGCEHPLCLTRIYQIQNCAQPPVQLQTSPKSSRKSTTSNSAVHFCKYRIESGTFTPQLLHYHHQFCDASKLSAHATNLELRLLPKSFSQEEIQYLLLLKTHIKLRTAEPSR